MVKVKCPGCLKQFEVGPSMANHQKGCKGLVRRITKLQSKRQADLKKQLKVKLARTSSLTDEIVSQNRQEIRDSINDVDPVHQSVQSPIPEVQQSKSYTSPIPVRSPSPPPRASGRPPRKIRLPKRFQDILPPAPPYVPMDLTDTDAVGLESADAAMDVGNTPSPPSENVTNTFRTQPDTYGVFREYANGQPSFTPDEHHNLADISDSPYLALDTSGSSRLSLRSIIGSIQKAVDSAATTTRDFFAPFRNVTIYRLMTWHYGSSLTKTLTELNTLVKDVLLAPDFRVEHLFGFSAAKEQKVMDDYKESGSAINPSPFAFDDTWIKSYVEISLPCDGVCHDSEEAAPKFKVEVHHRKIMDVIMSAYCEPEAGRFHLFPFKAFWEPMPGVEERMYSEMYTANAWNDDYEKILREHLAGPNSDIEAIMVGLLIWSDSTMLAQFGTADLWPIYLYIGQQSKYTRVKPSSFSAHHIAYMPKLGDDIQEFYMKAFGKPATAAMMTHLRRELAHAVWMLLMDDEFMHAYIHGLLFKVIDGIMRYLFPRFMTYSADYPEKILMSCLKYLSQCPCPRCLLLKSKIPLLGTKADARDRVKLRRVDDQARRDLIETVRAMMFEDGVNITSALIVQKLALKSLVPTRNAFSEKLFEHGFNFYQLFVPDLLHEFELGVWKAVFTHLMRILYAHGNDSIQKLNSRYRQVPPFGRDAIRNFTGNPSSMKRMAARDYEDLLQCAIPVFEGLLPKKHDRIVRELLFELATWHGLAKLRLHTETTVRDLENSTSRLGRLLRVDFMKHVCEDYETYDLPSEEAARGRRKTAAAKKKAESQPQTQAQTQPKSKTKGKARKKPKAAQSEGSDAEKPQPKSTKRSRRQRLFNMASYKPHALGGYAKAIRAYGTTDNYNSQTGELEHRRGKRFYKRVHKGKRIFGIGLQVRRERLLHRLRELRKEQEAEEAEPEVLPTTSPYKHHHIAKDVRQKINILQWLAKNQGDPATERFIPRLKNHLLSRLLGHEYIGDELPFTAEDQRSVVIEHNAMYRHSVLRVNYTTYDLRRGQDSVNPRTHPDVMVLSPESEDESDDYHPYWYARILGIYHVNVRHRDGPRSTFSEPQRMEFLFVRWFGQDIKARPGWRTKRLYRVGFVPGNDEVAFGFIDPAQVIRAVHLIPAFAWGHDTDRLPPSRVARLIGNHSEDWLYYYVALFSDRDLMMRFRGGGVGHKSTRKATDFFKNDRDALDAASGVEGEGEEVLQEEDDEDVVDGMSDADVEEDYGYVQDYLG